jgi:hypothetical protein
MTIGYFLTTYGNDDLYSWCIKSLKANRKPYLAIHYGVDHHSMSNISVIIPYGSPGNHGVVGRIAINDEVYLNKSLMEFIMHDCASHHYMFNSCETNKRKRYIYLETYFVYNEEREDYL